MPKPRARRRTPKGKTDTALDRLKARCPMGPPYAVLILDVESCEALTHGVVNSRVMVEAFRAVDALKPLPLPKDYHA